MNLDDVAEEIRAALGTISGLRTPPFGADAVTPPAALVALPVRIDYDDTAQRGSDRYPDVEVFVLVGKTLDRAARKLLAGYADGAGSGSVKAAVESYAYTSCDKATVRVYQAEFEEIRFGGVQYAAAVFHIDLTGDGA